MPTTLFQVTSNRIHDIELKDGSTVGDLRCILNDAGYDVVESFATVNRMEEGDKLIGQVNTYVLKEGDTVEFKTSKMDLPAFAAKVKRGLEQQADCCRQEGGHECGEGRCCHAKQQDKQEAKPVQSMDCGAGCHIEIKRTDDGVVISITR